MQVSVISRHHVFQAKCNFSYAHFPTIHAINWSTFAANHGTPASNTPMFPRKMITPEKGDNLQCSNQIASIAMTGTP
jgi:hypothetical protein